MGVAKTSRELLAGLALGSTIGAALTLGAFELSRRHQRRLLPRWLSRLIRATGLDQMSSSTAAAAGGDRLHPFRDITFQEMVDIRRQNMFSKLTLFYNDNPLCLVRGEGQYVFDETGRRYLDCVNNVAHVGHAHPRLVEAAMRQLGEINTNTRYLHPGRSRYAKKILSLFSPECGFDCVFFVNSGSEANDLALQLARAYTAHHDVIVLDSAYHGHTSTMIDMSPYKHHQVKSPEATKPSHPQYVHVVPCPDSYRGLHTGPDAGHKYGESVRNMVSGATGQGRTIAAFFAEGVMACGGQVTLPETYLQTAYEAVRGVGGLCVADEVQTGFGRVGSHFWAFETQGVCPDIVTTGKPIANGFPLSAVVTRREIAESLGMSYFNTFGGNNLAMAMGEETLDIILEERLQEQALRVSTHCRALMKQLGDKHELIGNVRGLGLMMGIELVTDRAAKTPAPEAASYVLRRARELGVHIQVDGTYENVLKMKPPMVFTLDDADLLMGTIDRALTEFERLQNNRQLPLPSNGAGQTA